MLKKQVGEFEAISQIPVHMEVRGRGRSISVQVRAGIYRILHEALSNVLQHSGASEVQVELEVDSDSVRMSVKDNGVGFNMVEARSGFGLDNMRRRAEEMGGRFRIASEEGAGTDVGVHLPFAAT